MRQHPTKCTTTNEDLLKVMAQAKPEESNNGEQGRSYHFLVAVYGIQGHLNPARTFAYRLAQIGGCSVTLSVPISGHRLMFPSHKEPYQEVSDDVITYIPFSDGKDDGIWPMNIEERMQRREESSKSLSAIVNHLKNSGRPVTCMVCTLNMPTVVDVAHQHNIPIAIYWIQPATAFLTYYHYFHGHDKIITQHAANPTYEVSLPGLSPLRIRDMPSFLTETTHNELSEMIIQSFRELFMQIDQENPVVLVNTFTALEDVALKAIQLYVDIFSIGPAVPTLGALQWPKASDAQIHLFRSDEENYMEWLDVQPEKSVVYLSFGSLLTYITRQVEEILHGLQDCGRGYLWVVRREGRVEDVDFYLGKIKRGKGRVVEWCDQLHVLSHPSVGCFVTHCGWNSTLEAIVHGVPMVAVPSWSDQPLNAHLITEWGVGVKAERDAEGILTRSELVSCAELLMSDNEKAKKIKASSHHLENRAKDALAEDGSLEGNLQNFIKRMQDL